jgi:hypothetical protein
MIKNTDYPSALTVSLKLLSDLIVLERAGNQHEEPISPIETALSRSSTPTPIPAKKDDYKQMLADSEKLLATISAHSQRINSLNKQISDTMASSYNILGRDKSAITDRSSKLIEARKSHKRRATLTHT